MWIHNLSETRFKVLLDALVIAKIVEETFIIELIRVLLAVKETVFIGVNSPTHATQNNIHTIKSFLSLYSNTRYVLSIQIRTQNVQKQELTTRLQQLEAKEKLKGGLKTVRHPITA
jgi:hypothetical protein